MGGQTGSGAGDGTGADGHGIPADVMRWLTPDRNAFPSPLDALRSLDDDGTPGPRNPDAAVDPVFD